MINSNKIFATIVAVMLAIIAVYYVDISDGVVENFITGSSLTHNSVRDNEYHPMSKPSQKPHPEIFFKNAVLPSISRASSIGLKAAVPDGQFEEYTPPQNCSQTTSENVGSSGNADSGNDDSLMRAVMASNNQMAISIKKSRTYGQGDHVRGDIVPCNTPKVGEAWRSTYVDSSSLHPGAMMMMTTISPNSTAAMVQMAKARGGETVTTGLYDDVSMQT